MSVIFPASNSQWLLVCVCALIFGIVTPNMSESAELITRPLNTSAVLMQPRTQAKVADYALILDDGFYDKDQALEVRVPDSKSKKHRNSAMAEIQMTTYGINGGNMKKPRKPSKPAGAVQEDKEVDALADQLGKTNFSERTPSSQRLWRHLSSAVRRASRSQRLRRLVRFGRRSSDAQSDTDTNMSESARNQGYGSA